MTPRTPNASCRHPAGTRRQSSLFSAPACAKRARSVQQLAGTIAREAGLVHTRRAHSSGWPTTAFSRRSVTTGRASHASPARNSATQTCSALAAVRTTNASAVPSHRRWGHQHAPLYIFYGRSRSKYTGWWVHGFTAGGWPCRQASSGGTGACIARGALGSVCPPRPRRCRLAAAAPRRSETSCAGRPLSTSLLVRSI
jgi:hypothetical protein